MNPKAVRPICEEITSDSNVRVKDEIIKISKINLFVSLQPSKSSPPVSVPRLVHVLYKVEKVALAYGFLFEYFGFPLLYLLSQCSTFKLHPSTINAK
jgi:hypothetical protein